MSTHQQKVDYAPEILQQAREEMLNRELKGEEFSQDRTLRGIQLRMIARQILLREKKADPDEQKSEKEEILRRDRAIIQFLMDGSSIFDNATLNSPALFKTLALEWLLGRFTRLGFRAGLLLGAPGNGKTTAVLAYAVKRLHEGEPERPWVRFDHSGKLSYCSARFVTAYELAIWLQAPRKYGDKLQEIRKVQLLIVDDLGTEPRGFKGEDFIADFTDLFAERHKRRKLTLITSNATIEDYQMTDANGNVETVAGIKSRYGARFVSRFKEFGDDFETTDPDFRQQKGV